MTRLEQFRDRFDAYLIGVARGRDYARRGFAEDAGDRSLEVSDCGCRPCRAERIGWVVGFTAERGP